VSAAGGHRATGLAKVQVELRDGRYLLAYSRLTTADNA
jgi:hypothetical protein